MSDFLSIWRRIPDLRNNITLASTSECDLKRQLVIFTEDFEFTSEWTKADAK